MEIIYDPILGRSRGRDNISNYDIAVQEGFVGSKSEWLASLGGSGSPQIQSDYTQTDSTKLDFVKNKPSIPTTLPASDVQVWAKQTTKPSYDYSEVQGKPTLFDGDFNSLTNKPSIAGTQVNADWNSVSGISQILNKPVITSQIQVDWNQVTAGALDFIKNKPTLFDGNYNSLSNKPTIPAAQVSVDWNAISGPAQILNKPTLFDKSYASLTGKPTLFDGTYSSLSGKPTIPSITGLISSSNITVILALTQAEYDSIVTPVSTTLYFIR